VEYLVLENVSKHYGEKVLFKNISLKITQGDRIALVAKNGSGKTTLLKVIAGEETAEGENKIVQIHKSIKFVYLKQDPVFNPEHDILEAIFDSDNPMIQAILRYEKSLLFPDRMQEAQAAMEQMDDLKAWDFETRIKEILTKLNITNYQQKVSSLSGGQAKRLALAKLIIEEPELLILDEPTNHLDLEMIEWLEKYLQQSKLTLFMVTHDRYFLERVCNYIVELDEGALYRYKGSYTDFLEKKAARQENDEVVLDKTKKLFHKELEWIRRMPQGRGTKAKSRVQKFDEIKDAASKNNNRDQIQIEIMGARLGSKIVEMDGVCKSFGDFLIVKDFFYKFRRKERVGIVGPNGVGKSTFLKLITKELRPDHGKVVLGETVVFGHYNQDGIQLTEDKRIIDVVRDVAEFIPLDKGMKLTAAQLLERFLFDRKQQQVYVSQLSGGEKRRLYLLTILMKNPNFLILDEPTNDLDIVTLNVLEDFLMDFPGCIIIVSHDRYFMDKLVEHLFIFEGNGKIKDYNSNYSDYREAKKTEEREQKEQERIQAAKTAGPVVAKEDKPKMSYLDRKEFNRLEKEIEKLEERKVAISERFLDSGISGEEIKKLSIELGEIDKAISDKETRWLELSELA
jgi:ABC transport system ATP-binding/permease protein